ncbi:MAG: TIGR04211 family SH3 domain-containing protein, partial [Porticoccaceae bacterium]
MFKTRINVLFGLLLATSFSIAEETDMPTTELATPEIGYISDQFYVPLRSSPCPTCKIVHKGLKSGTKLSVLGEQEEWTLVTTKSGYRGWIRSQHLANEPVARERLEESQFTINSLRSTNAQLELDMQNSFELVESLRASINELKTSRDRLSKELANIKSISSKGIVLDEQNQLLVKHNHMLQEERDVLRTNVDDLQKNKQNESMLYGGFLVLIGAILAAIIPRLRGRKRLSGWH